MFKLLLSDRCLVLPDDPIDETPGGILLPAGAVEKPRFGIVLVTGPGKTAELTGVLIPIRVRKGDRVMFTIYSGAHAGDLEIDAKDYVDVLPNIESHKSFSNGKVICRAMNEHEIIGVITEGEVSKNNKVRRERIVLEDKEIDDVTKSLLGAK